MEECKPLEALTDAGHEGMGDPMSETLTLSKLLELIKFNKEVHRLIRQIMAPVDHVDGDDEPDHTTEIAAQANCIKAVELSAAPATICLAAAPEPAQPKDLLRDELIMELNLLDAVKADADLAEAWLMADESEGRQLVRLLAIVSEWDEVLRLWGRLADRCKNGRRSATDEEVGILEAVLHFNNLRWRDRSAALVSAKVGADFRHEEMERGTPKGNAVEEVWLPGIANAAGQIQKKTLVKT
jgi:hypothetical protein